MKLEPKDEKEIKAEKELEKKIEKQNKTFHKYRSALSELSKQDINEILDENSLNAGTRDEVLIKINIYCLGLCFSLFEYLQHISITCVIALWLKLILTKYYFTVIGPFGWYYDFWCSCTMSRL